ncbi:hypothetical protein HK105_202950 [Polyrhizophydium stewartii]|uniref:Pre-mRNA-processing factor 19 n=1 Tax=Polyrhizophydium stewartii TaxID=2732419 RepID=A0ABR4NDR3_9FUNG
MFCSISGVAPEEPVVSVKSGHVYEKRLILKHLADQGVEPATNEPLTEDDLVVVRAAGATNEWDAVMLETHSLRQQLHASRLELANALYEYDAAKRVIARLLKERDDARAKLAAFSASSAAAAKAEPAAAHHAAAKAEPADVEMEGAADPLPAEVVAKLDETAARLSEIRRKKKDFPTLATADELASFAVVAEAKTVHSAKDPASRSLDLLVEPEGEEAVSWVLSGGHDGSLFVINADADARGESVASLNKAHSKAINSVAWIAGASGRRAALSAGVDGVVRTWDVDRAKTAFKIKNTGAIEGLHSGEITALSAHPAGGLFFSVGTDGAWTLADIERGAAVATVTHPDVSGYTAAQVHPDGLIFGAGTPDAVVRLWDVKSRANVHNFEGHSGAIGSIAFSENGYYLATSANADPTVRVWDLRKLKCIHSIDVPAPADHGAGVARVRFDRSGQYLAAACANQISIYLAKKWTEVATIAHHTASIADFAFGPDAKYIVSAGDERRVLFTASA